MGLHFSIDIFGIVARYTDVALPCYFALQSLGWRCCVRRGASTRNTTNIVFGAHSLPVNVLIPKGSIIYNFEPVDSPFITPQYVKRMQRAAGVWDFDERNARSLSQRINVKASYVFPGYVPEMTCLEPAEHNIGLLFYGAKSERRTATMAAIEQHGIDFVWYMGFDAGRDSAIARADMVLNVHATAEAPLEMSRLGFLLANGKAILSEDCPRLGIPKGLEDACVYASYEELPAMALKMHKTPSLREGIAKRGQKAYMAKPLADILKKIVGVPNHAVPDFLVPAVINVGSGNDFMPHCLNIDINPIKNPDVIVDLSQPLPEGQVFKTTRFGDIRLVPGSFSRIMVHHVLEHIRDLATMMTNFLNLLEIGGEVEIAVPYELSCGAWQDPTHVRALNEKSWLYYSGWHAYLGWRDACFDISEQKFEFSDFGKELLKEGRSEEEILRVPRAVATQYVLLRKRETTAEERKEYDLKLRTVYTPNCAGWRL